MDEVTAFRLFDLAPNSAAFLTDVLHGLSQAQKQIPPKYFYDEAGARLFEAICELPEYYVTRTETAMMSEYADEMAALIGSDSILIEYGSGASRKTRCLIEASRPRLYMPIDIARETLLDAARAIERDYPPLTVWAVCADYSLPLAPPEPSPAFDGRKLVYFPGSTIGNFTPEEALIFLANARQAAGDSGAMLIGVDLKKSKSVLEAAYDDAQGVTAQFNLNLLARANRELGADFNLARFRHLAFYEPRLGRIEMHLVSRKDQQVTIAGRVFEFREGETIHTENSYKYSVDEFCNLACSAGFEPVKCWVDRNALFSIHYLSAAGR